jgi:hypothetical protein
MQIAEDLNSYRLANITNVDRIKTTRSYEFSYGIAGLLAVRDVEKHGTLIDLIRALDDFGF